MREKYESLPLTTLKDIARDRGIKHLSAMKKADVVEALLATDPTPEAVSDTGSNTAPEVYSPSTDEKNVSKNSAAETDATENDAAPRYTVKSNIREYNRENRTSGMQRSGVPGGRQQQMGRKTYVQNTVSNYNTRSTTQNASNGYNARPTASKPVIRQYRGEDIIDPEADAREQAEEEKKISLESLDSGEMAEGILEVMPEGFGFIRSANYLPGDNDVYVAPSQIRRFNMKTGDIVKGTKRIKASTEKFAALLFVNEINGFPTRAAEKRPNFEDLTPVFPDSRLHLEVPGGKVSMRIMDLLCPIGKGQRGMIVSPPKAGKTTLLKQVAQSIKINHPSIHLIILLIDERPEEVTDIKESIEGPNAEVIYSTFDELPEHHKRVSEMVLERAKRLVEHGMDVVILLDSITRLARAYNLTVAPSGRTLSGGLDPAALHMPKRFFGAARNMREGGSLTILATALVETGSRMDDVVFEEFKGTGNMELVLNRKLSEKRIFPAVDILKSSTRRDDLLLTAEEQEAVENIRRATSGMKADEAVERILDMFARTRNNQEFISMAKKTRFI
jgi:transcription termination factor Rho